MSFIVKIISISQPTFDGVETLLETVHTVFATADECLYRARNEIRRATFSDSDVVIKSFKVPNYVNRFVYAYLRKSKARRSYENALRLQSIGILTPLPIAFKEVHRWWLLAESYYIAGYVVMSYELREVLHGEQNAVERENVLRAFGEFVYQLHRQGVLHRDLSPGNVLVCEKKGHYDFYLVDTNRMFFGVLSDQQCYKNFAMLWAADRDLEIIVTAYAEAAGEEPSVACQRALHYSREHKHRAERKKRIKRRLRNLRK